MATKRIQIPGTEVVAFPLFRVLDGSDTGDYLQRVEPSPAGSAKMGRALTDVVLGVNMAYWTASGADPDALLDRESSGGSLDNGSGSGGSGDCGSRDGGSHTSSPLFQEMPRN